MGVSILSNYRMRLTIPPMSTFLLTLFIFGPSTKTHLNWAYRNLNLTWGNCFMHPFYACCTQWEIITAPNGLICPFISLIVHSSWFPNPSPPLPFFTAARHTSFTWHYQTSFIIVVCCTFAICRSTIIGIPNCQWKHRNCHHQSHYIVVEGKWL